MADNGIMAVVYDYSDKMIREAETLSLDFADAISLEVEGGLSKRKKDLLAVAFVHHMGSLRDLQAATRDIIQGRKSSVGHLLPAKGPKKASRKSKKPKSKLRI